MTAVAGSVRLRPRATRVLALARHPHAALAALLAAGAALRVLACVAIYPGIFFSDTNDYVREAATFVLSTRRVGGYAAVVAPFYALGSAFALIVFQHLLGLAIVVLLYTLLVRRGVSPWVALLACLPAALDAYFVDIEHMIMSETVFHLALLGALAALLWRERPNAWTAAAAGLLLGYAGVVRSVAVPMAALFVAYLLVRRVGPARVLAFAAAWAVVIAGYASAFDVQHGTFGFTEYGGRFLYGQVAPFAKCSRIPDLPPGERFLCPDNAPGLTRTGYLWATRSPIHGLPVYWDPLVKDFAERVIRAQPLDYAGLVAGSMLHYLAPGHYMVRNDYPVGEWQFPADVHDWRAPNYLGPIRRGHPVRHQVKPNPFVARMVRHWRFDPAVARFLHGYQRLTSPSGGLLSACLLLVVVALLLRRGAWRLRLDAALLAACALCGLLVAAALSVFDYRYALEALILLPAAAALAWTAARGVRSPRTSRRAAAWRPRTRTG